MSSAALFFLFASSLAAEVGPGQYIVELADEPAAVRLVRDYRQAAARRAALPVVRARVRAAQQGARRLIEREQCRVLAGVDTVANALIVQAEESQLARLARLSGVAGVRPVRLFRPVLDRVQALHRVAEAWAQAGAEQAGAGVKIAVIDSGIDHLHPGFRATALTMPEGFPRANTEDDLSFTNNKVIVARSYAALFARRESDPSPRDRVGHGTAVAMAAAGEPHAAGLAFISGVAPKAWLGNYKVFGTPGINDSASEAAILKAIDDAIADGMDVVNLSLGNDLAPRLEHDPLVAAIERASRLGVIVVTSAGNNGPDPTTIGSPATAPSAITVGALTSDRMFAASVTLGDAITYAAVPSSAPQPAAPVRGALVDIAGLDGDGLACSSLPAGSLTGKIPLILRGTCTFEEKLNHVQQAGAIAALVYTDAARPAPITMSVGTATLPAEMVSYSSGVAIKNRLRDEPGLTATLQFTIGPVAVEGGRPADFSPQGPNLDQGIKPELVAVGTHVYTATQSYDARGDMYSASGYIEVSGTSFSAPVVAGAAAVVKAARPGLSSEQYRSLIINSARPFGSGSGLGNVQQVGAGMLDVEAALRLPAAVTPATMHFAAAAPDTVDARSLTITNLGTASDVFVLSVAPAGPDPGFFLSRNTIELAPGASATIDVGLNTTALAQGAYQGHLVIQGSSSAVAARVPYWVAVKSDRPASIILLSTTQSARRAATVRNAATFRIVDAAGLTLSEVSPVIESVSGGGEISGLTSLDNLYPGVFRLSVTLGPQAGANVFRIKAGEVVRELVIQAQ